MRVDSNQPSLRELFTSAPVLREANVSPPREPTLPELMTRLGPALESLRPEVRKLIGQMLLAYARDPSQVP